MSRYLWLASGICSVVAVFKLMVWLAAANGAPQEAAAAAVALCWSIIPYVLARTWDELNRATNDHRKPPAHPPEPKPAQASAEKGGDRWASM
jgi:hypothetical protein